MKQPTSRGTAGPHVGIAGSSPDHPQKPSGGRTIISWNLLRTVGASFDDVAQLVHREGPDLLLMQEATREIEGLCGKVGGHYAWAPLPGRIHGLAMWSPVPWLRSPVVRSLPAGSLIQRVCQVVDLGDFAVANVHLSHGQVLNRRQLRSIIGLLPPRAAVLGDFNLVGPTLLPGFRDVGPRHPTHVMGDIVPLRIDRCMVRGLTCNAAKVLPKERSDHHPIVVRLAAGPIHVERRFVRYMEAAAGYRHRAAALAGFGR